MSPTHPRNTGFTLVEFLVTTAIMALLLAALMPALKRARGVTLSLQCMGHLRQQSLAVAAYAEDHDGRFPATGRWEATWMIRIRHYMGYTDRASIPVISGGRGDVNSIDRLVPAFRCPLTKTWPSRNYYHGTYGINLNLVSPEARDLQPRDYYGRTRDNLINAPSRIYLVSDNYQYSTERWDQLTNATTPGYSLPRHHDFGVNILFMDSHVAHLKRGQRRDLFYFDSPARKPDGWW